MQPCTGSSFHVFDITQLISDLRASIPRRVDPVPTESELLPLFTRLQTEYRTNSVFEEAKKSLIDLYQMTEFGPPSELIHLVDRNPPAASFTYPSALFESYFSPLKDCNYPVRLVSSEEISDESSPEGCESRIIETGTFHSESSEPALIQFFQLVETKEADITGVVSKSDTTYLDELDSLISNPFVETALTQILHDELELRRLHLLKYALLKLDDLYASIGVESPENIHTLTVAINDRIEKAFTPPLFPEEIILEYYDRIPSKPLNRKAFESIASELVTFRASLIYHTESEAVILTHMIESVSFKLTQTLHWNYFTSLFPFESLKAFKETCKSKQTTDVICSLMEYLLAKLACPKQVAAPSSSNPETDLAQTIKPLPIRVAAPAPVVIAEQVTHSNRVRRFPKEIGSQYLYHFPLFDAGLKAMWERDLRGALEQSNNLIKVFERQLDIPKTPLENYRWSEALADFFCLVSDQLEILQRDDPSDNELYNTNIIKLLECKSSVVNYYFQKEYQIEDEDITKALMAFLCQLNRLHADSALSDLKALKKQKT